jgi:hypothetical protein
MFELKTERARNEGSDISEAVHQEAVPYLMMSGVLGWILNATGIVPDPEKFVGDTELLLNHAAGQMS